MTYLMLILTIIQIIIYLVSGFTIITASVSSRFRIWLKGIIIEALRDFFKQCSNLT